MVSKLLDTITRALHRGHAQVHVFSSFVASSSAFSGITLAPLAGAAAALEIAEGLDLDLLTPYRVNRFTKIFKNKGL